MSIDTKAIRRDNARRAIREPIVETLCDEVDRLRKALAEALTLALETVDEDTPHAWRVRYNTLIDAQRSP